MNLNTVLSEIRQAQKDMENISQRNPSLFNLSGHSVLPKQYKSNQYTPITENLMKYKI